VNKWSENTTRTFPEVKNDYLKSQTEVTSFKNDKNNYLINKINNKQLYRFDDYLNEYPKHQISSFGDNSDVSYYRRPNCWTASDSGIPFPKRNSHLQKSQNNNNNNKIISLRDSKGILSPTCFLQQNLWTPKNDSR